MNNGKICVSVCARNAKEMIAKLDKSAEFADVLELRLDSLSGPDAAIVLEEASSPKTLLATFRAKEQGGNGDFTFAERSEFWLRVGERFWADIEEDAFSLATDPALKIVSFHDFEDSPADLAEIYARLGGLGSDVIKIAVHANDVIDAIPVWKLLERARSDGMPLIPIAMGDAGKWTRVLGLAHGAFMTYAASDTGDETAPGQITARDMADVFRVKELDRNTEVFGVIGDPIVQSLSPFMHNPAFALRGINAVFVSLLVKNIDEFMRRMVKPARREVELNFGGFSVTMPHKQSIISHLDEIDPTAKAIGAVNTVKIDGGKMTGYNTDAHGFITPLKAQLGDVRGARVAVLGAGGATRAVVFALREEHADVVVFARDERKADLVAGDFGVGSAKISAITDGGSRISEDFDILVDTTPLGMKGPFENESHLSAAQLEGLKFVYDLVTRPIDTPIIREAKEAGVPAIGGLEMLIAQGAKQFEIWTGQTAPTELMRDSLIARMPK